MDTFRCPTCGRELPANQALRIPVVASIGFFVITAGAAVFGKLCRECHSTMMGLGAIGVLLGSVVLIVAGAKWLWG